MLADTLCVNLVELVTGWCFFLHDFYASWNVVDYLLGSARCSGLLNVFWLFAIILKFPLVRASSVWLARFGRVLAVGDTQSIFGVSYENVESIIPQ